MNRRSIAMALLGILLLLIVAGGSSMRTRLVNTQELDISGTGTVDISYTSAPITIYPSDTDKLVVKEYMNRDSLRYFARINQSGGTTRIQQGERNFLDFVVCEVEIYMPAVHLSNLAVTTASGRIKADTMLDAGTMNIGTASGAITLDGVKGDNIRIHATSGSVRVEYAEGKHDLSTVSGSVKLFGGTGSGSLSTTSGSIDARYDRVDGDIRAECASGSVYVEVPADAAFDFQASTVSGRISTFFDDQIDNDKYKARGKVNGGGHRLELKTISGSIKVKER